MFHHRHSHFDLSPQHGQLHQHKEHEHEEYLDDASHTKKLIVKSIVTQLFSGVPFHNLQLPIGAWDGTSFLERLSRFFTYSPVMVKIRDAPDPLSRLFGVLQFYLSGWPTFPMDIKRPFVPLQGEVFSCSFVHDQCTVQYLAEQIQTSPPTTAFCVYNKESRMYLDASMTPVVKHGINSIETALQGVLQAHLMDHNETYILNYPSIALHGVVWGKMTMSIRGDVQIRSPETGYVINLQFRKGKQLRGEIFKGSSYTPLYTLFGHWCSVIYLEDCATKMVYKLFDAKETIPGQKVVTPLEQQQPYESQRVWKDPVAYMRAGNEDLFLQAKRNVDSQPALSTSPQMFEFNQVTQRWQLKNLQAYFGTTPSTSVSSAPVTAAIPTISSSTSTPISTSYTTSPTTITTGATPVSTLSSPYGYTSYTTTSSAVLPQSTYATMYQQQPSSYVTTTTPYGTVSSATDPTSNASWYRRFF